MRHLLIYAACFIPLAICAVLSRILATGTPNSTNMIGATRDDFVAASAGWMAAGYVLTAVAIAASLYWDWMKWDERRALRKMERAKQLQERAERLPERGR